MTRQRLTPEDRLKVGTYIALILHGLHKASGLSKHGFSKQLGSTTLLDTVGRYWCPTQDYVRTNKWCKVLRGFVSRELWETAGIGDFLTAYGSHKSYEHLMVFGQEPAAEAERAPETARVSEETAAQEAPPPAPLEAEPVRARKPKRIKGAAYQAELAYSGRVFAFLYKCSGLNRKSFASRTGLGAGIDGAIYGKWRPTPQYLDKIGFIERVQTLCPKEAWETAGVGDYLTAYVRREPWNPLMVLREDAKVIVKKRETSSAKAVRRRAPARNVESEDVSRAIEDLLRISAKAATQNKTKSDFFAQDSAGEAPREDCYFLAPFAEAKKTFGQYDFAFVTDCIIRFGHVWSEASLEDREACLCQQRIVCAQKPLLPTKTRWVQAACGLVHNIDNVMGRRVPLASAYESARSRRLQDDDMDGFEVNPLNSMLMIHRGMDLRLSVSCALDVLKWAENTVLPHDETPKAPLRKHIMGRLFALAPTPAQGD